MGKPITGDDKIEKHLDGIKDAIDELSRIRAPTKRLAAARDLVEYINLHHIDVLRS